MTKRKSATASPEANKRQNMRMSVYKTDISQTSISSSSTASVESPSAAITPEPMSATSSPLSSSSSSSTGSLKSSGRATPASGLENSSTMSDSGATPASPVPLQESTVTVLGARNGTPDVGMEITGTITEAKRESSYDGTVIMPSCVSTELNFHPSLALAISQQKQPGSFPSFPTGDVFITADPGLGLKRFRLQLHSAALARRSPWFARTLMEVQPENLLPLWYSYTLQKGDGNNALPVLVWNSTAGERPYIDIEDGVEIKREEGEETGSESTSNGHAVVVHQDTMSLSVKAYYDLLAHFYGTALPISSTDILTALIQSEELVKVATALECLPSIRTEINEIFSSFRKPLFLAIKDDPVRWMKIAIATQSGMIYPECLTHLVGSHPVNLWGTRRNELPARLRQLIAARASELEKRCIYVNESLLMSTIEIHRTPVSPEDSQHFETWAVVSLFRDWIARQLHRMDQSKTGRIRGWGTFYRKIAKGGSAYLEFEEVRDLCGEMMRSRWEGLGGDLKLLKGHVAGIVDNVAKNGLLIDPDEYGIGYLTCYQPQPSDWLW